MVHLDVTKMCADQQMSLELNLLQLNRTQFPSLGIFVIKKVGNQKNKTTFVSSVLKVVLCISQLFY